MAPSCWYRSDKFSLKGRVGVTVFFSFSDGDTRNLMDELSLVQLSVDTFLLEI